MNTKDYTLGFILGLISALLNVINLCFLLYFSNVEYVLRIVLVLSPAIINILFFKCNSYIKWAYRRILFWLFFLILATLLVFVFGALILTEEDNILELVKYNTYDFFSTNKKALRNVLYCIMSHILGTIASLIIVGICKRKELKKHRKILKQKQEILKEKKHKTQ